MTSQADKKIMKYSHASKDVGAQGRTLINRIETQMDKVRQRMEDMVLKHGMTECIASEVYIVNKGRYQGLAAALGILRSSSVGEEIKRSNERLGIDGD